MSQIAMSYWTPGDPGSQAQLREVLALYKLSKKTLGFMPDSAFTERAPRQGLLLGYIDGRVSGYVLYDRPRNAVKLIHVCVDPRARGHRLAKRMLDFIAAANPHRSQMIAACREDYGLDSFWRSVGMRPMSEKAGRALGGSTLVNWIRPLGAPNLFEDADLTSGLPMAVLDSNIVSDLYSSPSVQRGDREASSALSSDWVQSAVTFVISGEVDFEIASIVNAKERAHQREGISHLTRLATKRPDDYSTETKILALIGPKEVARDRSLTDDVKHLADAIHAGADYFVTNDSNLLRLAKLANLSSLGTLVLRPHQVILRLREEAEDTTFESRIIDSVDLVWKSAGDDLPELEVAFLSYESGEDGRDFKRTVRTVLAHQPAIQTRVLADPTGRLWAFTALSREKDSLVVHILRAARGHRGATVSFQLTRHLRREALAAGLTRIVIRDPHLDKTMSGALDTDGFENGEARLVLGVLTAQELAAAINTPEQTLSSSSITEAERVFWPLVVTQAAIPAYLVPIRPKYAELLFGFTQALYVDRKRGLGLSREHVYFFGSSVKLAEGPARLLWYVTADDHHADRLLVARSRLIEAAILTVDEAHARFGHLGVLTKSDLDGAANKRGQVNVIRFEDTELLDRPLNRQTLASIYAKHGIVGNLQTIRSAPAGLFDDVVNSQVIAKGSA